MRAAVAPGSDRRQPLRGPARAVHPSILTRILSPVTHHLSPFPMINGPSWSQKLRTEIGKAVIGQDAVIERMLVALLANGHVLLEGMPGLAKTLLVKSLGVALGV